MELLNNIDQLKVYRGDNFIINDKIQILQPTLGQICDYGEKKYYEMIHMLCSVGADLKWQLDDKGIDYTSIPDYELFYMLLARGFSVDDTRIIFGDILDFSQMQLVENVETDEIVMMQHCNDKEDIIIDRCTYSMIVKTLRMMHGLKRNNEIPGNEATRQILIQDAKEEYEENKNKPYKSILLPMISAVVNSEGFKRNDVTVFDMKICAFTDSVKRISKIKKSDLLLQSGYSGFGIDLKKINNEELNWIGELD